MTSSMLRTAIDMKLNGEAAVSRSRDPFGEGPIGHVKSAGGFDLTSKLTQRGSSVKLTVGEQ